MCCLCDDGDETLPEVWDLIFASLALFLDESFLRHLDEAVKHDPNLLVEVIQFGELLWSTFFGQCIGLHTLPHWQTIVHQKESLSALC